jgi:endonuclease G, mitochondrial
MPTSKDRSDNTDSSKGKPDKPSSQQMQALREFVKSRGAQFLSDKNITSVGVGYKHKDGKSTGQIAIQFTVGKKALPEALEALGTQLIPDSFTIGGKQFPTDVIQRRYSAHYHVTEAIEEERRKRRVDPLRPGISIASAKMPIAGTLGMFVWDAHDGATYALSNWHVLSGPDGAIGDDIVQPGPYDDDRVTRNVIGSLVRSHVGFAGDCAIATVEHRGFDPKVLDLEITINALGEPELDDKVIKSGRTTGVTRGIVNRVHTIAKIDYGGATGERQIGCFEIGVDPRKQPERGEVSMSGDSGAVWLFVDANSKPTSIMAGLHFAGEAGSDEPEHAIACYPKSVFAKLGISITPPSKLEAKSALGFRADFLSQATGLPKLSKTQQEQAFSLGGSAVLDYTHFSLALNQERRFAFWVAWNVDGGSLIKLDRKGLDFTADPRVPAKYQAGDKLYAGNRLDRGHIARRADLLWGTAAEASQANRDSFYFTNITPQLDAFNQGAKGGLWGRLEDAVFENVAVEDLKLSVYGGPVFSAGDREYRGYKLPREFWKVLAYVDGGRLKAKAFLLTQNLDQLEALELDEFKVYQVALKDIETKCDLTFPPALKTADTYSPRRGSRAESLAAPRALECAEDISWD